MNHFSFIRISSKLCFQWALDHYFITYNPWNMTKCVLFWPTVKVTNKGVTWGHFENASYVVHFPSERRYYGFKSRNIFVLEIWGQTGSKIEFFWIFLKMTLTIWLIFLLKADIIGSDQETRRWGNTMIFLAVMKM